MVSKDKTDGLMGFADKLEQIEDMLNKRRWAKGCLRANIAEPHQIVYRGVKKHC